MATPPALSNEQVTRLVELRVAGQSFREIGRVLGTSHQTVARTARRPDVLRRILLEEGRRKNAIRARERRQRLKAAELHALHGQNERSEDAAVERQRAAIRQAAGVDPRPTQPPVRVHADDGRPWRGGSRILAVFSIPNVAEGAGSPRTLYEDRSLRRRATSTDDSRTGPAWVSLRDRSGRTMLVPRGSDDERFYRDRGFTE